MAWQALNKVHLGASNDGDHSKGDESRVQAVHHVRDRGFHCSIAAGGIVKSEVAVAVL